MIEKILFIFSIPPPFGGGEIASQFLYDKLKNRYDCIVFSRKSYSKIKQDNFYFNSLFFGIYFIGRIILNIVVHRPKSIYIGLPKGFLAFLRNSFIIWFSSLFRIKIISELHGMNFPFIENSNYKYRVFKFILKRVHKLRVLAYSIEKYIYKIGFKGKVYIIPNGVDKPNNMSIKKKSTNSILNLLYIGSISIKKGFCRLIEVINSLENYYKDKIHLNVIGEFSSKIEFQQISQLIDEYQLNSTVTFRGHLIDTDKWQALLNNDLLIHLSSWDGQPMTIIETMSLGIPTIATKVGAIPEMIENNINGFLVDHNYEVKEIIVKIIDRNINYSKISKSAIKTYSKYYRGNLMINNIIKMVSHD